MGGEELERALRETLAHRVATPPRLAADPAGVAIRRATRAQRRRTATGVALAAVATVTVSAGLAQLDAEPRLPSEAVVVLGDPDASVPPPTALAVFPPAPAVDLPPGVDLVLGDVLTSGDSPRLTLAGLRPVERVQRGREGVGWLVVGGPTTAGRSLWFVDPSGPPKMLLSGADEILVSRDGVHVAWREGAQLGAGRILSAKVIATVRRAAPGGAVPVAFVGDQVVVRLRPDQPGHALWQPSSGRLVDGPDRTTTHVFGVRPDGLVVAQVTAGQPRRPCVALLDSALGLTPTRTTCGPVLSGDGTGGVSPDGRWLLVNGSDSALLMDLAATTPTAWPAGPPISGAVAWAAGTALHVTDDRLLVRIGAAATQGSVEVVSSPVTGLGAGDRALPVSGPGS